MKSTTYRGEALGLSVCAHVYTIQGDGFQERFLATSGFFLWGEGAGVTNDENPRSKK
jgi:hypothetical protein